MSTYCMSDIHGHKTEFDAMLSKIGFDDDDELYVIGDIIDRGLESAEMLKFAVEDAPSNIHFMLGNHEDMMTSALNDAGDAWPRIDLNSPWSYNGGDTTLFEVGCLVDSDSWVKKRLLPWSRSLDIFKMIDVNGRKFMLVHAGFDPGRCESANKDVAIHRGLQWGFSRNSELGARCDDEEVGWGFGVQNDQDMLWIRSEWLYGKDRMPYDVVCGHTYVENIMISDINEAGIEAHGGGGSIAHIMNKHIIDCGCSRANYDEPDSSNEHRLACLRLDDMREFYVDCLTNDQVVDLL